MRRSSHATATFSTCTSMYLFEFHFPGGLPTPVVVFFSTNNNVTEYRFYPPQTHHSLATVTYRRIRPYFRHQIRLRCRAVRPRVLKCNKNEACQVRHRSPQNDVQVDGLQINLLRGRIHMDYSI